MNWFEIKNEIRRKLLSRNLETPNRRLRELDNLEKLFNINFQDFIDNPQQNFQSTDKNVFKTKVAKHKKNGKLNGAEISLINEIYKVVNDGSR